MCGGVWAVLVRALYEAGPPYIRRTESVQLCRCTPSPQATELNDDDRTVDARVIITILDLNDHAPVFEQSTYSANVSESLDVGDLVVMVTALDRDTVSSG